MEIKPTPRNLCGQLTDRLGHQIVSGELPPGETVPQEAVLCEQAGVSRTVVREAIKSLAAKGLVESRTKRGTVVLPIRRWNFLDPDIIAWQADSDSTGTNLLQLTEFRKTIEPAAAALAAKNANENQLQEIRVAWEGMDAAFQAGDVSEFLRCDNEFHISILYATGNQFFSPIANVIAVSLQSSLKVANRRPLENKNSIPFHKSILDAILQRDADEAAARMLAMLTDASIRVEKALGDTMPVEASV